MIRQTHCKSTNINVSVIGFPGINIGTREHVGKSCLINRFLSHLPYNENHISVVSLSDFDGEVICGTHWLYWGEGSVSIGDNVSATMKIVEQCDFVDDHLFTPISVSVPYIERCLNTELTLHSRKLAYVCKDQLGHECAFPRTYLESGTLRINVFICVYDMTLSGPSAFQQASFLQQVLLHLSSSKIPVVLATSKHDGEVTQVASSLLDDVVKSVKKRWIRRHFCIVETSSRFNINVTRVFQCALSLATSKTNVSQLSRLLRSNDASKSLSQRIKNSVDCKLQHFYYEAPANNPVPPSICRPGLTGFLDLPSYSYCSSECTNSHFLQNPTWKSDVTTRKDPNGLMAPLLPNFYPSPTCQIPNQQSLSSPTMIQSPKPCFPSQCPSRLIIKPGDHGDGSVLPTPPPLLLPGPRSPGLFGPISCPSFFESSIHTQFKSNPRSNTDYPLARLHVHGSIEIVEAITKSLVRSCPLDRYQTRLGHRYRVWILSGSKPDEYKQILNDYNSNTNINNMNNTPIQPALSKRPDFLSIRPSQANLNKSLPSAFSAPSQSPVESSPDFPSPKTNAVSSHGLMSCPISPVNEIKDNPISRPPSPSSPLRESPQSSSSLSCSPSMDVCLHLSTYSTAVELQTSMLFLDSIDANCPEDDSSFDKSTRVVKILIYWCLSHHSTDLIDLMLRGIHLTSRAKIPLIIVDQKSSSCLLSHLLDLASIHSSNLIDHSWTPIDLTCLLPNLVQYLPLELLLPSDNSYLNRSRFQFDGILTGLILHDCLSVPSDQSSRLHSTMTNRPFFLSPAVAIPTAIRIKSPNSGVLAHECVSCFGPRFIQLEQAIKLLKDHLSSSTCGVSSTYCNILAIHCHASQWTDQQQMVCNMTETILATYSSTESTLACQSSCLIVLVVLGTEGDHSETPYLQCLASMAEKHKTSLLLPPSSIAHQSLPTDIREPNSALPAIPLDTGLSSLVRTVPKALLGLLFLSGIDSVSKSLYKRILEGDLDGWYSTDKTSLNASSSTPTTLQPPSSLSNHSNMIHPTPNCSSSTTVPNTCVYDTIPNSTNYPHHQTEIQSGMVELPWLPLSPADALRIPSSDHSLAAQFAAGLTFSPRDYPLVSTIDKTRIPAVPSSSGFWTDSYRTLSQSFNESHHANYPNHNTTTPTTSSEATQRLSPSLATESGGGGGGLNSSVEEYYAELPKITQPNVFKLDYEHRPHPDRPKRPLPRTASVNSRSSQSSSPFLVNRFNQSTPNSVEHLIPSIHYGNCDLDSNDNDNINTVESPIHSPNPSFNQANQNNDDVSAVYAEVNDALVYKDPSEIDALPQLPPPRTNLNFMPSVCCYHYDFPYMTGPNLVTSTLAPCSTATVGTHTLRASSQVRRNSPIFLHNNGSTKSCKARFFRSQLQFNAFLPHQPHDGHCSSSGVDGVGGNSSFSFYPAPVQPAPPPPLPSLGSTNNAILKPCSTIANFPNASRSFPSIALCRHQNPSSVESGNAYQVSDIPAKSDCCCTTTSTAAATGSVWHCQPSGKDYNSGTFRICSPQSYCDNKQPPLSSDSNTNSSASGPSQPNHSLSSTLDSLTAAFKRHGVWLRHSTSRRSRKSKA